MRCARGLSSIKSPNMTLSLPPNHVNQVLSQCKLMLGFQTVTRRQLEAIVGLLNFAGPMLHLGKLFLTPIIIWMNSFTSANLRDLPIQVDASLKRALLPFIDRKFLETPTSFRPLLPSLDISTDASGSGWSGVIGRHRVQDCWTPLDRSNHINVKELRAILYSLHFFKDVLSNRTIRILTDNSAALFCLKRMGSLHSPHLDSVTRELILFCNLRSISFVPVS